MGIGSARGAAPSAFGRPTGLARSVVIAHHGTMASPLEQFDRVLAESLDRWGIPIIAEQLQTLRHHFQAVVETNRTLNLTRITDPVEAAVKHYADSLALLLWVRKQQLSTKTLLDIGTGAGFPAVPLAVMMPDWEVTALDATRKKADFLTRTANTLHLSNLRVECAHSDHWQPGGRFHLVVLRAVGKLAVCLRQGGRHVARDGRLVVYKTASLEADELDAATAKAKGLRIRERERFMYDLQLTEETIHRALHVYAMNYER